MNNMQGHHMNSNNKNINTGEYMTSDVHNQIHNDTKNISIVLNNGAEKNILTYIESIEGKLPKNVADHILYNYRHKKAILLLDCYYNNPYGRAAYRRLCLHDADKLFMYGVLKDIKEASKLHRATSVHHWKNWIPGDNVGRYETALDYESARYTKPDKPLNAYMTVETYYPEIKHEITPYLIDMGINSPENKDIRYVRWTDEQEAELMNEVIGTINNFYKLYKSGFTLEEVLKEFNRIYI